MTVSFCQIDSGEKARANVTGNIVNSSGQPQSYSISIAFLVNAQIAGAATSNGTVGPHQTVAWAATSLLNSSAGALTCKVASASTTPIGGR